MKLPPMHAIYLMYADTTDLRHRFNVRSRWLMPQATLDALLYGERQSKPIDASKVRIFDLPVAIDDNAPFTLEVRLEFR